MEKACVAVALQYAKSVSNDVLEIEEKLDSGGVVVGFSVDWRFTKNCDRAKIAVEKVLSFCETLPVVVIRYEEQPFFDVFPCAINKGEALLDLKQKLGVRDGVLFMGDSAADNPAFAVADVGVGVVHTETPRNLDCEYFVRFEEIADFLENLLENCFCFSANFPTILRARK
jgi:hydroxymethylpyrimidine pyrophosphatase-like HAD family hydrolase